MLQSEVISIVKSTAPLLAKEGENITRLFYQKLFIQHPELQNVFNMTHQTQGEQPRALADSVFKYASHIDKLEELGPLVKRIAHKHASLSVSPEQYPVVGKYLLEAIGEHLSLSSDDPVITAWASAYQQLAAIFVTTEEKIYSDNASKPGGWRGFRAFIISEVVPEAEGVTSFYLKPEDNAAIADFEPGQYVGVKIETPEGEYEEIRQYSLSAAPGESFYRITVKSESNHAEHPGRVSNHLHDASIGDKLFLQPPTGDFTIADKDQDLLLIAGGVGITPLLSMLLSRLEERGNGDGVTFILCCRNAAHHIMKDKLKRLSDKYGFEYKVAYEVGEGADHQGYLDEAILNNWLKNREADVYFCGPKPFMGALDNILAALGYVEQQRHCEIFGPATPLH
jgi:nitric oxide dioxygenase